MKKSVLFAGMILLAASCSNERVDSVDNFQVMDAVAPVTVSVSGFSITQASFSGTRGTAVGDVTNVKALTLAFYRQSDGVEVYKHTQIRSALPAEETFGEFSTSLGIGTYTLVVLANAGNNAITLTSPTEATYGENQVMDTFAATQTVTVSSSAALSVSATLDRIVTALAVRSTDNRPEDVVYMRFTYTGGGKTFNPSTGLALSNAGFVNQMAFSGAAGSTTYTGGYLFLVSDEQTMDVTIETLDAEEHVVLSKTIEGVPLKRNRQTTLTGSLYGNSNASVSANSFMVNTSWLDAQNINF